MKILKKLWKNFFDRVKIFYNKIKKITKQELYEKTKAILFFSMLFIIFLFNLQSTKGNVTYAQVDLEGNYNLLKNNNRSTFDDFNLTNVTILTDITTGDNGNTLYTGSDGKVYEIIKQVEQTSTGLSFDTNPTPELTYVRSSNFKNKYDVWNWVTIWDNDNSSSDNFQFFDSTSQTIAIDDNSRWNIVEGAKKVAYSLYKFVPNWTEKYHEGGWFKRTQNFDESLNTNYIPSTSTNNDYKEYFTVEITNKVSTVLSQKTSTISWLDALLPKPNDETTDLYGSSLTTGAYSSNSGTDDFSIAFEYDLQTKGKTYTTRNINDEDISVVKGQTLNTLTNIRSYVKGNYLYVYNKDFVFQKISGGTIYEGAFLEYSISKNASSLGTKTIAEINEMKKNNPDYFNTSFLVSPTSEQEIQRSSFYEQQVTEDNYFKSGTMWNDKGSLDNFSSNDYSLTKIYKKLNDTIIQKTIKSYVPSFDNNIYSFETTKKDENGNDKITDWSNDTIKTSVDGGVINKDKPIQSKTSVSLLLNYKEVKTDNSNIFYSKYNDLEGKQALKFVEGEEIENKEYVQQTVYAEKAAIKKETITDIPYSTESNSTYYKLNSANASNTTTEKDYYSKEEIGSYFLSTGKFNYNHLSLDNNKKSETKYISATDSNNFAKATSVSDTLYDTNGITKINKNNYYYNSNDSYPYYDISSKNDSGNTVTSLQQEQYAETKGWVQGNTDVIDLHGSTTGSQSSGNTYYSNNIKQNGYKKTNYYYTAGTEKSVTGSYEEYSLNTPVSTSNSQILSSTYTGSSFRIYNNYYLNSDATTYYYTKRLILTKVTLKCFNKDTITVYIPNICIGTDVKTQLKVGTEGSNLSFFGINRGYTSCFTSNSLSSTMNSTTATNLKSNHPTTTKGGWSWVNGRPKYISPRTMDHYYKITSVSTDYSTCTKSYLPLYCLLTASPPYYSVSGAYNLGGVVAKSQRENPEYYSYSYKTTSTDSANKYRFTYIDYTCHSASIDPTEYHSSENSTYFVKINNNYLTTTYSKVYYTNTRTTYNWQTISYYKTGYKYYISPNDGTEIITSGTKKYDSGSKQHSVFDRNQEYTHCTTKANGNSTVTFYKYDKYKLININNTGTIDDPSFTKTKFLQTSSTSDFTEQKEYNGELCTFVYKYQSRYYNFTRYTFDGAKITFSKTKNDDSKIILETELKKLTSNNGTYSYKQINESADVDLSTPKDSNIKSYTNSTKTISGNVVSFSGVATTDRSFYKKVVYHNYSYLINGVRHYHNEKNTNYLYKYYALKATPITINYDTNMWEESSNVSYEDRNTNVSVSIMKKVTKTGTFYSVISNGVIIKTLNNVDLYDTSAIECDNVDENVSSNTYHITTENLNKYKIYESDKQITKYICSDTNNTVFIRNGIMYNSYNSAVSENKNDIYKNILTSINVEELQNGENKILSNPLESLAITENGVKYIIRNNIKYVYNTEDGLYHSVLYMNGAKTVYVLNGAADKTFYKYDVFKKTSSIKNSDNALEETILYTYNASQKGLENADELSTLSTNQLNEKSRIFNSGETPVMNTNKNLFDITSFYKAGVLNHYSYSQSFDFKTLNSKYVLTSKNINYLTTISNLTLQPNTTYTMSVNASSNNTAFFKISDITESSKEVVINNNENATQTYKITFTTNNSGIIKYSFENTEVEKYISINWIQVEKNDSFTGYVPFIKNITSGKEFTYELTSESDINTEKAESSQLYTYYEWKQNYTFNTQKATSDQNSDKFFSEPVTGISAINSKLIVKPSYTTIDFSKLNLPLGSYIDGEMGLEKNINFIQPNNNDYIGGHPYIIKYVLYNNIFEKKKIEEGTTEKFFNITDKSLIKVSSTTAEANNAARYYSTMDNGDVNLYYSVKDNKYFSILSNDIFHNYKEYTKGTGTYEKISFSSKDELEKFNSSYLNVNDNLIDSIVLNNSFGPVSSVSNTGFTIENREILKSLVYNVSEKTTYNNLFTKELQKETYIPRITGKSVNTIEIYYNKKPFLTINTKNMYNNKNYKFVYEVKENNGEYTVSNFRIKENTIASDEVAITDTTPLSNSHQNQYYDLFTNKGDGNVFGFNYLSTNVTINGIPYTYKDTYFKFKIENPLYTYQEYVKQIDAGNYVLDSNSQIKSSILGYNLITKTYDENYSSADKENYIAYNKPELTQSFKEGKKYNNITTIYDFSKNIKVVDYTLKLSSKENKLNFNNIYNYDNLNLNNTFAVLNLKSEPNVEGFSSNAYSNTLAYYEKTSYYKNYVESISPIGSIYNTGETTIANGVYTGGGTGVSITKTDESYSLDDLNTGDNLTTSFVNNDEMFTSDDSSDTKVYEHLKINKGLVTYSFDPQIQYYGYPMTETFQKLSEKDTELNSIKAEYTGFIYDNYSLNMIYDTKTNTTINYLDSLSQNMGLLNLYLNLYVKYSGEILDENNFKSIINNSKTIIENNTAIKKGLQESGFNNTHLLFENYTNSNNNQVSLASQIFNTNMNSLNITFDSKNQIIMVSSLTLNDVLKGYSGSDETLKQLYQLVYNAKNNKLINSAYSDLFNKECIDGSSTVIEIYKAMEKAIKEAEKEDYYILQKKNILYIYLKEIEPVYESISLYSNDINDNYTNSNNADDAVLGASTSGRKDYISLDDESAILLPTIYIGGSIPTYKYEKGSVSIKSPLNYIVYSSIQTNVVKENGTVEEPTTNKDYYKEEAKINFSSTFDLSKLKNETSFSLNSENYVKSIENLQRKMTLIGINSSYLTDQITTFNDILKQLKSMEMSDEEINNSILNPTFKIIDEINQEYNNVLSNKNSVKEFDILKEIIINNLTYNEDFVKDATIKDYILSTNFSYLALKLYSITAYLERIRATNEYDLSVEAYNYGFKNIENSITDSLEIDGGNLGKTSDWNSTGNSTMTQITTGLEKTGTNVLSTVGNFFKKQYYNTDQVFKNIQTGLDTAGYFLGKYNEDKKPTITIANMVYQINYENLLFTSKVANRVKTAISTAEMVPGERSRRYVAYITEDSAEDYYMSTTQSSRSISSNSYTQERKLIFVEKTVYLRKEDNLSEGYFDDWNINYTSEVTVYIPKMIYDDYENEINGTKFMLQEGGTYGLNPLPSEFTYSGSELGISTSTAIPSNTTTNTFSDMVLIYDNKTKDTYVSAEDFNNDDGTISTFNKDYITYKNKKYYIYSKENKTNYSIKEKYKKLEHDFYPTQTPTGYAGKSEMMYFEQITDCKNVYYYDTLYNRLTNDQTNLIKPFEFNNNNIKTDSYYLNKEDTNYVANKNNLTLQINNIDLNDITDMNISNVNFIQNIEYSLYYKVDNNGETAKDGFISNTEYVETNEGQTTSMTTCFLQTMLSYNDGEISNNSIVDTNVTKNLLFSTTTKDFYTTMFWNYTNNFNISINDKNELYLALSEPVNINLPKNSEFVLAIRLRYDNGNLSSTYQKKIVTGSDLVNNPYGNSIIEKNITSSSNYIDPNALIAGTNLPNSAWMNEHIDADIAKLFFTDYDLCTDAISLGIPKKYHLQYFKQSLKVIGGSTIIQFGSNTIDFSKSTIMLTNGKNETSGYKSGQSPYFVTTNEGFKIYDFKKVFGNKYSSNMIGITDEFGIPNFIFNENLFNIKIINPSSTMISIVGKEIKLSYKTWLLPEVNFYYLDFNQNGAYDKYSNGNYYGIDGKPINTEKTDRIPVSVSEDGTNVYTITQTRKIQKIGNDYYLVPFTSSDHTIITN